MDAESKNWSVWEGPEIEGHTDLGVKTLFVRDNFYPLERDEDKKLLDSYDRIWFCAEYIHIDVINYIADTLNKSVCYELNPLFKREEISPNVQCYLKVKFNLLPKDHICVGLPYNDESFVIGTGNKVSVSDYKVDVRIR